jgi:hypothetical protein
MKLRYLLLSSLAAASVAGAAHAVVPAGVTGTVTVNGFVADRCQFTTPSQTINLGELSQSDGTLDTTKVTGNVNLVGWCNGTAATMDVVANPLLRVGPVVVPSGFTTRVDYTGTATANAVSDSDGSTAAGADNAPTVVGLFTGNVNVALSAGVASANKLVAGDYQGTVVVTLTPNVSFGGL